MASFLSCRVFRLWQLLHSWRSLSGVNALSIAAGPSARVTSLSKRQFGCVVLGDRVCLMRL